MHKTFSGHPNYQGIITHGGWSTVLESLYYGRPMILMPLFAGTLKSFLSNMHYFQIILKMQEL